MLNTQSQFSFLSPYIWSPFPSSFVLEKTLWSDPQGKGPSSIWIKKVFSRSENLFTPSHLCYADCGIVYIIFFPNAVCSISSFPNYPKLNFLCKYEEARFLVEKGYILCKYKYNFQDHKLNVKLWGKKPNSYILPKLNSMNVGYWLIRND